MQPGQRQRGSDEGREPDRAVLRADVFDMVGKPLPTSLHAGIDITIIALWLGHEQIATAQIYLHADMEQKERAIARVTPPCTTPGRYHPPDALLAFLDSL